MTFRGNYLLLARLSLFRVARVIWQRNNKKVVILMLIIFVVGVAFWLCWPFSSAHRQEVNQDYPRHTHIVTTMFWVGEILNAHITDGSQVCSAYDVQWAKHWSGGLDKGSAPPGTACEGSPIGGCDGNTDESGRTCTSGLRTAKNNYFPPHMTPAENPFYLALPFDDLNDQVAYNERCQVIPWAHDPQYANRCRDKNFSYMKNRWVRMTGPTGHTCYGQIEDAGPSHDGLYHDDRYVFGDKDVRPIQEQYDNSGIDTSPALYSCLGLNDNAMQDQQKVYTDWQFVNEKDVPAGPWRQLVTKSGVAR